MRKHRFSGIDSTYEKGGFFKDPGYLPGMDVLDARDGTDTWYQRHVDDCEKSAEAIVSLMVEAA